MRRELLAAQKEAEAVRLRAAEQKALAEFAERKRMADQKALADKHAQNKLIQNTMNKRMNYIKSIGNKSQSNADDFVVFCAQLLEEKSNNDMSLDKRKTIYSVYQKVSKEILEYIDQYLTKNDAAIKESIRYEIVNLLRILPCYDLLSRDCQLALTRSSLILPVTEEDFTIVSALSALVGGNNSTAQMKQQSIQVAANAGNFIKKLIRDIELDEDKKLDESKKLADNKKLDDDKKIPAEDVRLIAAIAKKNESELLQLSSAGFGRAYSALAMTHLGTTVASVKDKKAMTYFNHAISTKNPDSDANVGIAICYDYKHGLDAADNTKAWEFYQKAYNTRPTPLAAFYMGWCVELGHVWPGKDLSADERSKLAVKFYSEAAQGKIEDFHLIELSRSVEALYRLSGCFLDYAMNPEDGQIKANRFYGLATLFRASAEIDEPTQARALDVKTKLSRKPAERVLPAKAKTENELILAELRQLPVSYNEFYEHRLKR